MKKEPTIADVAKLAEVSPSTVSRVINNSSSISAPTKEKVRMAISMLNYQKNAVASSLRKKQTKAIGIVISDNDNPFFSKVIKGVEKVAWDAGYHVIISNTENSLEIEQNQIKALLQKRVDGLIISVAKEKGSHLNIIRNVNIPVIFINRQPNITGVSVVADNIQGIELAVKHLCEKGHRKIGFIQGNLAYSTGYTRFEGYKQTLTSLGISYNPLFVKAGNFNREESEKAMLKLLQQEETPTAVIASDVYGTMGVLKAIQKMNLKVPEDISIIGFDNPDWTELIVPPLTVISQPRFEMGERAANLILANGKANNHESEVTIRLPCRLIERDSVQYLS